MRGPAIPHSRPWLVESDLRAVAAALGDGMIACGARVRAFEAAVGAWLGCLPGVACASGKAALVLALRAVGVRPGRQVILPTYVCRSVMEAVLAVGAVPRLCDVGGDGVVSVETVRAQVTAATGAIVAVHLFGRPCDVAGLAGFGVPVIEDACQAFGLRLAGGAAGTLGAAGVLSFHATKCLTTGEGGMLVTRDAALAQRARRLAGSPLSDLQAALGLAQLARYGEFLARRRQIEGRYVATLAGVGAVPAAAGFLFRFTVTARQPFELLRGRFLEHGIHVRRGVDELLHRLVGEGDAGFPGAVRLFETNLSLPFYPGLSEGECRRVCAAARSVLGGAVPA